MYYKGMSVAALVPLEEYLGKSYEPDCEYVDGSIVERNVGEYFHSLLQSLVVMHLNNLREVYGVKFRAIVEQRVRVRGGDDSARRYRIPDVCVLEAGHRKTPVTLDPPVLVVEILSPDDRLDTTIRKCADYAAMGVPTIWIADPRARILYEVINGKAVECIGQQPAFQSGGLSIPVDFTALFAQLDEE